MLLVPAISAYLLWTERETVRWGSPTRGAGILLGVLGLIAALVAVTAGRAMTSRDFGMGSWSILGYVLLLLGAGFWFLGGGFMRSARFPALFLLLMVPPPAGAAGWAGAAGCAGAWVAGAAPPPHADSNTPANTNNERTDLVNFIWILLLKRIGFGSHLC